MPTEATTTNAVLDAASDYVKDKTAANLHRLERAVEAREAEVRKILEVSDG